MRVIEPKDISLVSSNVAENDHAEWSNSTDYTTGTRVIVIAEHRIYEAIANSGPSHGGAIDPVTNSALSEPTAWVNVGATNRWKMFDEFVNTRTDGGTSLVVEVDAVRSDAVALIGVQASSILIEQLVDGTVVDSTTRSLLIDRATSWFEFFYEDVQERSDTFWAAFAPRYGATIRVTVTHASNAQVGTLIVGRSYYVGITQINPNVGFLDFSREETDAFGQTYLKQGAAALLNTYNVLIENDRIDAVKRKLFTLRAVPAVYVADDAADPAESQESLIVYGYYRDLSIVVERGRPHTYDTLSLEIRGLI